MNKTINIVSFDVPYPANYGGVIDVFYKIKTLKENGVDVILHVFAYGRKPSEELESLCKRVYYYDRNTSPFAHFSVLPYIVKSRCSENLLNNLLTNNYPILFEGLHTTYFLGHLKLKHRKKVVRTHNIEHEYYYNLFLSEKNILKKMFFLVEKCKLKLYESQLRNADAIATISERDTIYFSKNFSNVHKVYPFHRNKDLLANLKDDNFILYHGNLSVSENIGAVLFLLKNVFSKTNKKVIIAGSNPTDFLVGEIFKYKNVVLEKNPNQNRMDELKHNAKAHILYSKTNSGLKLKLIDSLFSAKNIIINDKILQGENLNNVCIVANSDKDILSSIEDVFSADTPLLSLEKRMEAIEKFSNKVNAEELLGLLFN